MQQGKLGCSHHHSAGALYKVHSQLRVNVTTANPAEMRYQLVTVHDLKVICSNVAHISATLSQRNGQVLFIKLEESLYVSQYRVPSTKNRAVHTSSQTMAKTLLQS